MASVKLSVEAIPHAREGSVRLFQRVPPRISLSGPDLEPPDHVRTEEVSVPLIEVGEAIVPGLSYRLRIGAYCPTKDPHEIRLVVAEGTMELREADALRMPSLLSSLYYERKRAAIAEGRARGRGPRGRGRETGRAAAVRFLT